MRKFLTTLLLLVFLAPYAMRADEVIIGNGTEEDYSVPFNTGYTYSWNETIYPGSEIGNACTINAISFNCNAADTIPTLTLTEVDIYMGITQRNNMSSLLDWTPAEDLTLVYSGENVLIGDTKWEKIKLDNPFYYTGNGNLVVVIAKKTDFEFNMQLKWYYTKSAETENTVMFRRNDSTESIADEFPNGHQANGRLSYRPNIKLEVVYGEVDSPLSVNPSSLDLGNRPIGAWMSPMEVDLTTEEPLTITSITSSNPFFTVSQIEMPYELTAENTLKLKVSHFAGNDGQQNGEIVINHTLGTETIPVTATAYTPQTNDVWEMPAVVSSYPFVDSPEYSTLQNNYMLPGDEADGADVVYRLNFSEETTFSAAVTGNNGKVALYAAHFNGKGGPHVNNYYGAEPDDDDDDDPYQEPLGESFIFDFNDGSMDGWKTKDADGDYCNWAVSNGGGIDGYDGTKCIYSESYSPTSNAALTPDNYIYTDGTYTITENSMLSFHALPLDTYYSDEHYGVVVSLDGVNFTTIWEHTVQYDEVAEWQYKTIDLSDYSGRNVFIGLRHFDCTNEYAILIDNVQLTSGNKTRSSNISNQTVPAGVYYLVASATEQFSVSINTKNDGGYNTVAEVVAQEIDDNNVSVVWSWDFINEAKEETSEVSNFKLYRKNNDSQEEILIADNVTDTTYVDATWGNAISGVYRYGVSVVYAESKFETPIVWSNNIDKDMAISVTVNVEASNGASVAGTHVSFVSVNDVTYSYETTLDESGTYTWDDFRIGTYQYTISLEGFESCATNEVVEITESTVIDCTLEEMFHVGDFYVSPTGWAMWNDEAASFEVKLNGQNVAEVTTPYYQFDVTSLVQGQEYTATVIGSKEMEYTWTYNSCENFVSANDFEAVVNGNTVELSWQLPIGACAKEFMYDFEDGTLDGFVTIDANNDGVSWMNSNQHSSVDCGYQSHYSAISCSYYNFYDIEPNDYLVTAKKYNITESSKLVFRVCAENQMFCAEHYGVAISTNSNTNADDFTMIWEETLTAKEGAKADRNERAQGTYYEKIVDLSAYAGQDVYIAIRHFDCFGQFFINIDNLTLTTTSKDEPNFTDLEVLGAMVYRNGELLTAEPIDKNEYTDVAPGYGDIEYSVRVVYGGEEDTYYAMSCPLTEEVTVARVCDAPKRLYGEEGFNENGESGISLVWPYTMHGSQWLYYDDNTVVTALGISGEPFYWGIMFPAEDLEFYGGTYLTKVSMYDREGHDGNINIYYGGDDAPEVLVHTQPYACTGSGQFVEYELTAPLPIDPSMNLWVTFNNNNGSFPAAVCASTGDPNGRWISFDGSYWVDVATQAMNYTWMIRAFVTSELKGTMELDNSKENIFEHYNVYRGTSSSNMEVVAEPTVGNYFDVVEPGTYYYQVTSVYTIDGEECESDPAYSYENPEQDYIVVEATLINENGVDGMMVYPNPAKDNLNIKAENMSRITITNTLGQVVYDVAADTDNAVIDMTQFEAGVYMVRIITDNGVAVERISKF